MMCAHEYAVILSFLLLFGDPPGVRMAFPWIIANVLDVFVSVLYFALFKASCDTVWIEDSNYGNVILTSLCLC